MSQTSMSEVVLSSPLGERLRVARESAGLSAEAAARALRLPVAIIHAMEQEDWSRLGAPIYVRAHLSAYLDRLGLPAAWVESAVAAKPAPVLTAMAAQSRLQGSLERGLRNAVYAVMTAVIVVPGAWLATHYDTRQKWMQAISLEPQATAMTTTRLPVETTTAVIPPSRLPNTDTSQRLDTAPSIATVAEADADQPAEFDTTAPMVASLAPFQSKPAQTVADSSDTTSLETAAGLKLHFREKSWFELDAADGSRIEHGLLEDGSERLLPAGAAVRITLGNAGAVEASTAGAALDLTPYRAANVARFTVSSTLDVAPADH